MTVREFINAVRLMYAMKVAQPENQEEAERLFTETNEMFRQARIERRGAVQEMVEAMLPEWEKFLTEEEFRRIIENVRV